MRKWHPYLQHFSDLDLDIEIIIATVKDIAQLQQFVISFCFPFSNYSSRLVEHKLTNSMPIFLGPATMQLL